VGRFDVVYIPPMTVHSLENTEHVPLRFVTVSVAVSREGGAGMQSVPHIG
jgi:mannose-6-phosphate isomerase-like protein (cupin superfamily)